MHNEDDQVLSGDEIISRRLKLELKDILFLKGLSNIDVAGKLMINPERVHKYTNPRCPNNNLPASLVPLWHREVGPELLTWIAAEARVAIVDIPNSAPVLHDAVTTAAKAMKECSEALATFSFAVVDGKVTAMEFKAVRREVQEAMSALATLQMVAEEMRRSR